MFLLATQISINILNIQSKKETKIKTTLSKFKYSTGKEKESFNVIIRVKLMTNIFNALQIWAAFQSIGTGE